MADLEAEGRRGDRGLSEEERDPFWALLCAWVLVAAGAVPRFAQYLHYRALSHDEAVLAHNLVTRPLGELFGPFGDSMAPAGYMVLTRWLGAVAGMNEYAMRAVPFAGGMIALLIFYPVARRLTSPGAALIGLALFAVGKEVIFFGDYVRPYSTDTLWALLILGLAGHMDRSKVSVLQGTFYAAVGAVAVWMSFPVLFFLVGIAATQLIFATATSSPHRIVSLCIVYCVWAASFIVLYLVTITHISSDGSTMDLMNDYYQYAHAFMPLPPKSYADLKWFNWNFIRVFDNPAGLTLPGLGAFAAVVGGLSLAGHRPRYLAYLLMPVAVALVVSSFERYPFWGRTILYIAPILFILIGAGVAFIGGGRSGRGKVAACALALMLLGVPSFRAANIVLAPTSHHELNKALEYAQTHWQEGDLLYVHYASSHSYYFAKNRYHFPESRVIVEPKFPPQDLNHETFIADQLPRFRKKGRLWVALTYDHPSAVQPFLDAMGVHGTQRDASHALGASVYLYAFGSEWIEAEDATPRPSA